MRAREWIEMRREINELVREAREIERQIHGSADAFVLMDQN